MERINKSQDLKSNPEETIKFLSDQGLPSEDISKIQKYSSEANFSIENIKQKIQDLKNLGFSNPPKMITTHPAILGLNIENIKQKIQDLKNLGFSNLIESIDSCSGYKI